MKTESLSEFLARGGKITRVPVQEPVKTVTVPKQATTGGPAVLMTLEEADLYYGERKEKKVKKKAGPTIDYHALPPEIRKKYVDNVIENLDLLDGDEEDED